MADDDVRRREIIAVAGWMLFGLAVISACHTGLNVAMMALEVELFGSGPSMSTWIFDSLRNLSEWRFISTVVVCAGLAVWLRGPKQELARRLFAGAAVAGLVALVCNPALVYALPKVSVIDRFFSMILFLSQIVWLAHFALVAAGVAAMGAGLGSEKMTQLVGLAASAVLCIAFRPLADMIWGGAAFGEPRGVLDYLSRAVLPVGDLLLAAAAAIVATRASPPRSEDAGALLRRALVIVCAGLSARILLSVYMVVENTLGRNLLGAATGREPLMQISTVGVASVVAALVPLLGVFWLWRSARDDDDRAVADRFAWTLVNWLVALVFELLSVAYATYHFLSDGYVNLGDVQLSVVVVGAIGALFGLFGMMTLFGGLGEIAARFEGVRWQNYATRARRVPKLLASAVGVSVLSSVVLRALSGPFRSPPLGLLLILVLGVGIFALVVAWQVFSTMFGITHRLVTEVERPESDGVW